MLNTSQSKNNLFTILIGIICCCQFFFQALAFAEQTTNPSNCTASQYKRLNNKQKYCALHTYACLSTGRFPFGGCSYTPWAKKQCPKQCKITKKAPWLSHKITKPTGSTKRTITYKNSCDFDVWVGYTGGAVTGLDNCKKNSDCISGSVCDPTGNNGTGQCFWKIDDMTNKDNTIKRLHLRMKGRRGNSHTLTLKNDIYQPKKDEAWIKWSGNTWASTDCTGSGGKMACKTAFCPTGGCKAYTGPRGPLALAEFTLQASAQDYYDVSIIGGYNIPIAMKPTGGQDYAKTPVGPHKQHDPLGNIVTVNPSAYWCTEPGSTSDTTYLKACSWVMKPAPYSTADLRSVHPLDKGNATSCTKDSDCKDVGGTLCGLWASGNKIKQVCGDAIGWWSGNEVCTFDDSSSVAKNVFKCTEAVSHQGTIRDLFLCIAPNNISGYTHTTSSKVCGCKDWPFQVSQLGCQASNSKWVKFGLPEAQVKKNSCPTAYSFPFDDETSTFNCQTSPHPGTDTAIKANVVNYTITFCPGGKTGR